MNFKTGLLHILILLQHLLLTLVWWKWVKYLKTCQYMNSLFSNLSFLRFQFSRLSLNYLKSIMLYNYMTLMLPYFFIDECSFSWMFYLVLMQKGWMMHSFVLVSLVLAFMQLWSGFLSFLLAFCIFVIGFVLFVSFLHLYTRLSFKLACVLPISFRPDCLSTYLH